MIYKNHSIPSSLITGAVALAILTTAVPAPIALAQSNPNSNLQAQITALLAQIQQLQSQLGTHSSTQPSALTLTRNLSLGMSGADVQALQRFLNSDPTTRIAISGAGSPGNETMFFGPATRAAVIAYQNKYRAEILTPAGLQQGTGFVGPATRAHMNARSVSTVTPSPIPVPDTNPAPESPESPQVPASILQGEGELRTVTLDSADDTRIREAAADAPIAIATLEARNGDLEISRLDVSLIGNSSNVERDPWDIFESISLWVDDEKVAERRIGNRTNFQNRTNGTVRFSGLNLILAEGREHDIVIAATLRNSVRGITSNPTWTVSVDSIRYKDAAGVVATDTTTGDLGQPVEFELVTRGDGEELKFGTSNRNPQEQTIIVDDRRRTNNVTLLGYTMAALGNDITLDRVYVNIETGTAAFSDVVADVRLKIGNRVFNEDSISTTGVYTPNSVLVAFDIDNRVTIARNNTVDVELLVDLKPKTAYQNSETIRAQITSTERDQTRAEGADNVEAFSGSIVGKVQTLITDGIFVSADSAQFKTETVGSNSTVGIFTIEFDVTAVEGDYYIASNASTSDIATTGGIQYRVESAVGDPVTVSGVLSSTAREDIDGIFTIREGRTETFTLTVTVDAVAAGSHRVWLEAIQFSDNPDGVTDGTTLPITPANKFRTPYQFINN